MPVADLERCREGTRIKLIKRVEDDEEKVEGRVVKRTQLALTLTDVTVDGDKQPGFEVVDIEDIAMLQIECESTSVPPPEEPKRRSTKSMISGQRAGQGDISHLNRLHQLRMPEILAQVQLEDPPAEHVITHQKFSPIVIPVPEQDAEHMEGDKYQVTFQSIH